MHRGAIRRGRARRARARPGPGARPTSPRGSAGPPGPPRRRVPRCRRAPGGRARPCRRGPGTPGVSRRCGQLAGGATGPTVGVGVRDPERDPVRPGHPAAAHHVEQRVRLGAEEPQEPGHGPLGQARVQGQVPSCRTQARRTRRPSRPGRWRRAAGGRRQTSGPTSGPAPDRRPRTRYPSPTGESARTHQRRQ